MILVIVVNAVITVIVVVSRRPTLKRGSGETLYKKFELWNVYWMTFTCYVSAIFTSQHPFNQICRELTSVQLYIDYYVIVNSHVQVACSNMIGCNHVVELVVCILKVVAKETLST